MTNPDSARVLFDFAFAIWWFWPVLAIFVAAVAAGASEGQDV